MTVAAPAQASSITAGTRAQRAQCPAEQPWSTTQCPPGVV